MNLHFKTKFDGKMPTGFKEKILKKIKKHSIVDDPKGRWRVDMEIQMVVNPYSPERDQFNEGRKDLSKVISIQQFSIKWKDYDYTVKVDSRELSKDEVEVLAINDGFDDLVQFLTYFSKSKSAKIIHWTKLKY